MAIYQLGEHRPEIDPSVWVAESADVIGRVRLAAGVNVWYGAVLRGDNDWITVGANCNIQDGAMLHIDSGVPLTLDEGVTVGHRVALHGCSIGACTLVGIGAVVLNHARIGRDSIVGAGSLVTEGKQFPDGVLIVGSPAKVVRELTPEQIARIRATPGHYVRQADWHRSQARRIDV